MDEAFEKRRIRYALFIPIGLVIVMMLTFMLEQGMDWNFTQGGIRPRHLQGLWGIITYGFIHGSWSHLINNCIALFVLSSFVCYFYPPIDLKILILSYFGSGILLWIFGRDSWHIGASGWIYALNFFLFFSGIFRKHIPLIAISLVVVFLYGNAVWHMFPWQKADPISWEGHLAGGIVGTALAIIYRHQGPQKPEMEEDDEEYEMKEDEDLNV